MKLCRRPYHVHCKVQNDTDLTIIYDRGWFESGEMAIEPPDKICPNTKVTFGVGGDGKTATMGSYFKGGVTGAARFHIDGGATFALGFSDPAVGFVKAGAAWSDKSKDGYDAVREEGNTVCSGGLKITALVSSKDSKRLLYVISKSNVVSIRAWA